MMNCVIRISDNFGINLNSDQLNELVRAQEPGIKAYVISCELFGVTHEHAIGTVDLYVSKEGDYITATFHPYRLPLLPIKIIQDFKESFEVWARDNYFREEVCSFDVVVRAEF